VLLRRLRGADQPHGALELTIPCRQRGQSFERPCKRDRAIRAASVHLACGSNAFAQPDGGFLFPSIEQERLPEQAERSLQSFGVRKRRRSVWRIRRTERWCLPGEASALDYDVSTRPKNAQRAWSNLEYGPQIAVPVIVIQGLRDVAVWPSETLRYAQRVIDAGRTDLLRLYLVKDMGHNPALPPAPTDALYVNSVRTLDVWVAAGLEPGPIDGGSLGSHPSCETRGHGIDPLACLAEVFGDGF
jgi:pimeloyl-ACP methyl ester carboxylesterase